MTETAANLINEIHDYYEKSYPDTAIDFAAKFAGRVRALGEQELPSA